jgi:hypothetical protein
MRRMTHVLAVAALPAFLALAWSGEALAQQEPAAPGVRRGPAIETLAGFVVNRGQWDPEVLYFARHAGIEATLTREAILLTPLRYPEAAEPPPAPLVIRLPGAAAVEGVGILPTAHHFILGTGTTSWVPGFAQVVYRDVVPGIDVVLREGEAWFAYDVHVDAGVDLGDLVLDFENASGLEIVDGVLVMETPSGPVQQHIGAAWEVDPATEERVAVSSGFRLLATAGTTTHIGFDAPGRDPGRAFVLDPSLVFATYVGSSTQEIFKDMAVAPDGSVLLAAKSLGAPTTPGALQSAPTGGSVDAWSGKLSPDGSTLEWGTYLGGSATEEAYGIDVDGDGTVVIVGRTHSPDFPTTPGSLQPIKASSSEGSDAFVTRLSPDGSGLVWSTFFGGPDDEWITSSGLSPSGAALLAGEPAGLGDDGPPATPGAFDQTYDQGEQFLAKVSADGTQLVFLTYFRASYVSDFAFDADDNIYFAGYIFAADAPLPATPGALKTAMDDGDSSDGFVAKLDPLGTQLHWATYVGGSEGSDTAHAIAVDQASAVYVVGSTKSNDFPVTGDVLDPSANGVIDGYVMKLLPGGSGAAWSTYLSACCGGVTFVTGVAVDPAGSAVVTGDSDRSNFPVTPDAFQSNFTGPSGTPDAHLTKLDAFGEGVIFSTYFGGNSNDLRPRVELDALHDPAFVMQSTSSTIPVTPGAYDSTYGGSGDMVVAKFSGLPLAPWRVLGGGLAGSIDMPNLAGAGDLTPGSSARLSLRGGLPSANSTIVAGLSALNAPFKGGTLVPTPTVTLPLITNPAGAFDLHFNWVPAPAGIDLFVQVWIKDPGAPTGWSASNGLQMTSQ